MILQKDENYELSETGKLIVGNMLPLLNTLEVIEDNKEYWKTRTQALTQWSFYAPGESLENFEPLHVSLLV